MRRTIKILIGLAAACLAALPLAANAETTLRIGVVSRTIFYLPAWTAEQQGFFKAEGIEPKIEIYNDTHKIFNDLKAGTIQIGISSIETVIEDGYKGGSLRLVAGAAQRPPHFIIAQPEIKTLADLKGKTIGISVIGGGTYGPFAMLLKKNGVDPDKDIKLVETSFSISEDALRQGRVDAVNMNQPFAARAEAKGGTRKLFSLSEEMPNIVHILEACRADFVDKNPELVKAYVRDITLGMKKALADRAETLKVVSEQLKAPIPVLDTYLLKDNDFGRDPGAAPNFEAIQKMLDIYAETGMLPKLDVAQFKHPTIVAPLQ